MLCKFSAGSGRPYTLEVNEFVRCDDPDGRLTAPWIQSEFMAEVLRRSDSRIPVFVHNPDDAANADFDELELTEYAGIFSAMAADTLLAGVAVIGQSNIELSMWGAHSLNRRLTLLALRITD